VLKERDGQGRWKIAALVFAGEEAPTVEEESP
jgi:hypothetical protein